MKLFKNCKKKLKILDWHYKIKMEKLINYIKK